METITYTGIKNNNTHLNLYLFDKSTIEIKLMIIDTIINNGKDIAMHAPRGHPHEPTTTEKAINPTSRRRKPIIIY